MKRNYGINPKYIRPSGTDLVSWRSCVFCLKKYVLNTRSHNKFTIVFSGSTLRCRNNMTNNLAFYCHLLLLLLGPFSGKDPPPRCWPLWLWRRFGSESAFCFLTDGLVCWSFPRLWVVTAGCTDWAHAHALIQSTVTLYVFANIVKSYITAQYKKQFHQAYNLTRATLLVIHLNT